MVLYGAGQVMEVTLPLARFVGLEGLSVVPRLLELEAALFHEDGNAWVGTSAGIRISSTDPGVEAALGEGRESRVGAGEGPVEIRTRFRLPE